MLAWLTVSLIGYSEIVNAFKRWGQFGQIYLIIARLHQAAQTIIILPFSHFINFAEAYGG